MKRFAFVLAASLAIVVAGCSRPADLVETAAVEAPAAGSGLSAVFVGEEPAGAIGVIALKQSDAESNVVVTGIIGGREAPFVAERAMFTLSDAGIEYCRADESCETPWDACCNPPEEIIASMITVQVTDAEGNVLRENAKGVNGLLPMARVTVRGDVVQRSDEVVTVSAQEIFVHPTGE